MHAKKNNIDSTFKETPPAFFLHLCHNKYIFRRYTFANCDFALLQEHSFSLRRAGLYSSLH